MTTDRKTSTYEPPALRVLGSVYGLTQGELMGAGTDGVLLVNVVVSASISGAI